MSISPGSTVAAIEKQFHDLIKYTAGHLVDHPEVQLPRLSGRRPTKAQPAWLPIPGMYGGFSYWWEGRGRRAKLIAESWCRIAAGSGQRHEITADGPRLIEQGFV